MFVATQQVEEEVHVLRDTTVLSCTVVRERQAHVLNVVRIERPRRCALTKLHYADRTLGIDSPNWSGQTGKICKLNGLLDG